MIRNMIKTKATSLMHTGKSKVGQVAHEVRRMTNDFPIPMPVVGDEESSNDIFSSAVFIKRMHTNRTESIQTKRILIGQYHLRQNTLSNRLKSSFFFATITSI